MPNSGSGDPTDPLAPVGAGRSGALTPAEDASGPSAASEVDATAAARRAAPTDAARSASDPSAIAAALADGSLDAEGARAQLIDHAVRSRLPPDATPETIAAVRAEVEALLGADPTLAGLLQPG